MGQLIDLCGTPIQLEKVKSFRLVKREWLFYPAYQEIEVQTHSLFARKKDQDKKKFQFTKMAPFGMVLSEKEKPSAGSYEIKSFGEAAALNVLDGLGKAVSNVAGLAADLLRLDTSGNKEFRLMTQGRCLTKIKLRDVPAKVAFLSGKVSDVYKNDPLYQFLGEPISPTVVAVPTLVVTVERTTYAFFGGGIDLEDAEATYQALLQAYNQLQEDAKNTKGQTLFPKFNVNLPKLSIPSIKLQSPFVMRKKDEVEQAPEVLLPEVEQADKE